MNINKSDLPGELSNKLSELFPENDAQDLQFEEMIINAELMGVVKALMNKNNISSRKELAEKLGVKAPHITRLFQGEKYFNVALLAKLQRVFKTTFIFNAQSLQTTVLDRDIKEYEEATESQEARIIPLPLVASSKDFSNWTDVNQELEFKEQM